MMRFASALRRRAKLGLHSSGYYYRNLAQVQFPGVAVLCYHGLLREADDSVPFRDLHVSRRVFEGHCRVIRDCCSPITMRDAVAAFAGAPLPERPVVVTFDDGYRSVWEFALPLLEKYQIPATVYACVEPIVNGHHFWYDTIGRERGEQATMEARRMPFDEWQRMIRSVATPALATELHRPMTVHMLRTLAQSPLIDVGAHTMTHPTLALASSEQQRHEINGSRAQLADLLGAEPLGFAYPYGLRTHDYSADSVDIVKAAGFGYAVSTNQQFASADCSAYEIPRFVMVDGIDEADLARRLTRLWGTVSPAK